MVESGNDVDQPFFVAIKKNDEFLLSFREISLEVIGFQRLFLIERHSKCHEPYLKVAPV